MEAILFVLLAAVVAVVGIGLGLAIAPRLSRWDERRNRTEDERHGGADADESVEGEGEVDRE
jgi:hypothetical protein